MPIILRNAVITSVLLVMSPGPAFAEDLWIATHNLMPGDIVRDDDIAAQPLDRLVPDAVPATRALTGLEMKRRVYVGHPIGTRDIGAPTAVKANAPVDVYWQAGTLTLVMQGSALEAGAVGDEIRVLNPATSRAVRGTITGDGTVELRSEP